LAIFAVLSIITGMVYNPRNGWIEGISIFIAIFVLVLITSISDWHKDKQFVQLQSFARDEDLPVVRGKHGQMETVNIWDLCVGDVVMLNAGDRVPADCIMIKGSRV
jgi:Ca2+-transporting ATPase